MRILLAHNSLYYPSHGGGDKSNRLLVEALAARGHEVRVVTRVERFGEADHERHLAELARRGVEPVEITAAIVRLRLRGVDVHTLTRSPQLRGYFQEQIQVFDPDVIVTSTDDPAQVLFDLAVAALRARVVYLVRATIAAPFGPDSSSPNAARTAGLRRADGTVGVSEYVAKYAREWGGLDAIHVPISLMEPSEDGVEPPFLADWSSPYISMVNPCAVKGISIFLTLADHMPRQRFAAVPTWGTTAADLDALRARPNITLLGPYDHIDDLLRQTRVMLVPSVWAEARSRVVLESLSRGVPVVASDVGGLHEAMLGVDHLLPVRPVQHYRPAVDEHMVPVAEVPEQDVAAWHEVLAKLTHDPAHWEELSVRSRRAALQYLEQLTVIPFETYLEELRARPKRESGGKAAEGLSPVKRKLLALRLQKRSAAENPWFPALEAGELRLFCFPFAGAGALAYRAWRGQLGEGVSVCPVRLPGRETRVAEAPLDTMGALVEALVREIRPYIETPFAFFGHSMGAAIAFELARALRRAGLAMPKRMVVSGARAPQFRLGHVPPPEPDEVAFLDELRRLGGLPADVVGNPALLKLALPALKADARLYRNYVYLPEEPLAVPIDAFGGDSDPNVQRHHVEAWHEQTSGGFTRREFAGGHFFLESRMGEVLEAVRELVRVC